MTLEEERDMYREKAHRFIASCGRWESQYALLYAEHESLVEALGRLHDEAESRPIMTIGASALRVYSEGHYREDGPNGETTSCHCGIGHDHDRADLLDPEGRP